MKPKVLKHSRRTFLKNTSIATATFSIVPASVLGGKYHTAPSDKLNIAGIGVAGVGKHYLLGAKRENFVANADIDKVLYQKIFENERFRTMAQEEFMKKMESAKYYQDYREMLDNEDIDAVMIGTPDHTHAIQTIEAIRRGKHVYCAKPLTKTIAESRFVRELARNSNVATQMSTQSDSLEEFRIIREWIWDGAIGDVTEVDIWTDRPIWPQGIERPTDTPAVPDTLDWDLFIGPAPYQPYHPAYHPFRFRGWYDFGTGALGDMGCHFFNPVFKALKLGQPDSIYASSTPLFPATYPNASIVHYSFPARDGFPALKLNWYDGGMKPERPKELESNREIHPTGILFRGSKGDLMCNSTGNDPRLLPESRHRSYKRPPKTEKRSIGHYEEWGEACKGGEPAGVEFEYGSLLTEIVLLGNIAIRTGEKLDWDGNRFTNNEEANNYLNEPYQNGWELK